MSLGHDEVMAKEQGRQEREDEILKLIYEIINNPYKYEGDASDECDEEVKEFGKAKESICQKVLLKLKSKIKGEK